MTARIWRDIPLRLLFAGLAATSLLSLPASLSAQTNLLANGGFETGAVSPWAGAASAQVTAAAAHSGSYGVRLPAAQLLTQGWIAVTPGRTYALTGWFRWTAFSGTDWGYSTVDVISSGWQVVAGITSLQTKYSQGDWHKLAVTFVPSTSSVQVRFGVYGPQQTVDMAFDDLQLFEKAANLPPTVAPTASITSGAAPLSIQFQANGDDADGAIAVYQWEFADGSVSSLPNPAHTFTEKRDYTVTLKVWDDEGATASQSLAIAVLSDGNPSLTISIPSASGTYTTSAGTATFGGSASAPPGRAIQGIVWDNIDTDQAGSLSVSPASSVSWTTGLVPLKPGRNEVLLTATDTAGAVAISRIVVTRTIAGPSISGITVPQSSVHVYEKYEVRFSVETVADKPFFEFDSAPPAGIVPGAGVTVEGEFVTPSGRVIRQPAFLFGEMKTTTANSRIHYEEAGRQYWVVRLSPLEEGSYSVSLSARDASGTVRVSVGTFSALAPRRRGFIRVSASDPRYFEFTNRALFLPIGPANGPDYTKHATAGINFERPWMAGRGAYSTNWSKWMRIDTPMGNEGYDPPLTHSERYPSHELSRELYYPGAHRIWMGEWLDEQFYPRLKAGITYQVKVRLRTTGIAGPLDSSRPYGLVIKPHDFPTATIDTDLRSRPSMIPPVSRDRGWHTVVAKYTATAETHYFSLLLDNVSAGRAYIDQLSVRELKSDGSLGGELIRHSHADAHTYVEQRPAAYFDWQVTRGEELGIFFKYVVQDKRDWVPNHLSRFGAFVNAGDGYFQPDRTKAKWLQRQWWRYLAARWGYSTAVHSWESCNEADPNDVNVWRHTQDFARYLHQIDAHPHLVTTSFWCCWKPEFWGDSSTYPDVDYADIHEYTKESPLALDMVEWVLSLAQTTNTPRAGKPVILAETGIGYSGQVYFEYLKRPNPGIWYHNLLWAQLNPLSGLTAPNYWWSEHFAQIDQTQIARPFHQFTMGLDVNLGGYVDAAATSSNAQIRVLGQKNPTKNAAYLWVQNKLHNWHNVMGVEGAVPVTPQSGTVTVRMAANTTYTVDWWNTYSGALQTTQPLTSDAAGNLTLPLSNLNDDVAIKVRGPVVAAPSEPLAVRVRQ